MSPSRIKPVLHAPPAAAWRTILVVLSCLGAMVLPPVVDLLRPPPPESLLLYALIFFFDLGAVGLGLTALAWAQRLHR
jgi:hypothetical protein